MKTDLKGLVTARIPVRLVDLSLGGARVAVEAALQEGAVHEFEFDLAGETVVTRALVKRCRSVDAGSGFEVGIEFIALGPGDEQRLKSYLETRA